ncbi:MAG: LptF/LptG family permease [Saprospiraceae bacterium]|nr:LptF/LptG family permease [Saprospiraceae bacterium]
MTTFKLKVLDRYLIGKFLSAAGFSLLICTMISVAIDFSDKVQSIIEEPCTIKDILAYYIGFIFQMSSLLMPLYTLIAVVFFTSRLAFNSEILSILNAGVSFSRLMRPYLIGGCLIAVFHLSINHLIAPVFNKWKLWFEHTFVWTNQDKGKTSNVHMLTASNVKVYIKGYNKNSKTMTGLRVEEFEGSQVKSILQAENARWKAEPNRWELTQWSVRTINGLKETFTRSNTPLDTAINISPQDFVYYHNQNEEMTTAELMDAIARERVRGQANVKSYEIEMHRRTADAVTNIILTIIGLAIAGRKVRGGLGLHLAVGIGIGAGFILMSKFAVSFAASGSIPVMLGMWIPNIIFAFVAVWLVIRAQK